MAKNKTKIEVTTVFDGELDATDVFVSLISQKYGKTNTKEYLAKKKDLKYNEDEVQKSQILDQRLCARRPLLGRRRGARQGHEGRLHDLP